MLRSPPGGLGAPAQLAALPKSPVPPIQVESACAALASKRFATTTQPTGITARRSIEFRLLNIVSSNKSPETGLSNRQPPRRLRVCGGAVSSLNRSELGFVPCRRRVIFQMNRFPLARPAQSAVLAG